MTLIKTLMRRLRHCVPVFLIPVLILIPLSIHVQQADQRLGKLINRSDWFELERQLPHLKDSIQTPWLGTLGDALTGLYFNRRNTTATAINTLLKQHQVEMGFEVVHKLVRLFTVRHTFFLDTGNGTAALSPCSYTNHQSSIDATAIKENRFTGGYGHVSTMEILRIPTYDLTIADRTIKISPVFVPLSDMDRGNPDDGNIGMSLVNACSRATINFKDMFIQVE